MSNYLGALYFGTNRYQLPIPTLDQLWMLYKLPNSPDLYMKAKEEYHPFDRKGGVFDKANPNYSIKCNQTFSTGETWALYVPLPVIWINPYLPEIVGKNIGPWTQGTGFVEVTSKLPQGGPGNWLNVVPGSGMFFNLKGLRILQGRNKLDVLLKLTTVEEIVSKFPNLRWNGWTDKGTSWSDQRDYIHTAFGIATLSDLIVQVAHNPKNIIPLEWISNCPVVDRWTYQLAKSKGYDVIHFYGTGYNLFWANEFVVISNQDFTSLTKSRILTTHSGPCVPTSSSMLVCSGWKWSPAPVTPGWRWAPLVVAILTGGAACAFVLIIIIYIARKTGKV